LARDEGRIEPVGSTPPRRTPIPPTPSRASSHEPPAESTRSASTAGASVSLYRAVGLAEAADIRSHGGLRQAPSGRSYEAKLFAGSFADAVRFGRLIQQRLPDPASFVIVEVSLAQTFVATLHQSEMDGMTAFTVDREQLAELNRSGSITIQSDIIAPGVRP
jgi:hypothetical protein